MNMFKNSILKYLFGIIIGVLISMLYFVPKLIDKEVKSVKNYIVTKEPQVYLEIEVNSDKVIKQLNICYPGQVAFCTFTNLKKFDFIKKAIYHSGEGSYSINVEFEDGNILSTEEYIEGNYRLKHQINNDSIYTKYLTWEFN